MGTWGDGLFDDDGAADLAGDAVEARPRQVAGLLREAMAYDEEAPDPYGTAAAVALVLHAVEPAGVEQHAPYLEGWPRADWTPDASLVAAARTTGEMLLAQEGLDEDESLLPGAREQLRALLDATSGSGSGGPGVPGPGTPGPGKPGGAGEPRRRWWRRG